MNDNSNKGSDPSGWVETHGNYLYRFALARVRDVSVSEDLVQETFMAALRARGKFEGRSAERTWLTGILKHKIYDHFRKAAKEKLHFERDGSDRGGDFSAEFFNPDGAYKTTPREWGRNPLDELELKDFMRVLRNCLSGLPEKLGRCFVLKEVDGLSGKEICELLDITPTNLWTMLYRARMRLRGCLQTNWLADGDEEA